jgi:hypothetical protein
MIAHLLAAVEKFGAGCSKMVAIGGVVLHQYRAGVRVGVDEKSVRCEADHDFDVGAHGDRRAAATERRGGWRVQNAWWVVLLLSTEASRQRVAGHGAIGE